MLFFNSSKCSSGKVCSNNNKGYTLIELIIITSLIGILSTFGVAAFVRYNESQKLNSAVLNAVNIFQTAKTKAQAQIKPSGCLDNESLNGYRVIFCSKAPGQCLAQDYNAETDPETIALYASCGLRNDVDPGGENVKKLPSDISVSSNPYDFLFNVVSGQVSGITGDTVMTLTRGGSSKAIRITQNGLIKIE